MPEPADSKKKMSGSPAQKVVIYGDVLSDEKRRKLKTGFAGHQQFLIWREDTVLAEAGECSAVYVDLDNPRFADPDFLISVATVGERLRLIGKSNAPSMEQTLRVSRLGISEVLDPDACFQQLESFLHELEEAPRTARGNGNPDEFDGLVGSSSQMQEIRNTIKVLSTVDFPSALILGETGTGKSLISRILHNTGLRADNNLVEVNCSAIPDELFESELFGHVKGAFTDAKADKPGLFEYADRGTLFLDEIGNLSLSAQAKLLKVLEDKKLRKVGAIEETDVSVRVVAATNSELEDAVRRGTFREDLYFRINLLSIEIPPLRERPADIPDLVSHYLRFYATLYSKPIGGVSDAVMERLLGHAWPGNIRELCNVIERAVLLCKRDTIDVNHLDGALRRSRVTPAERRQVVVELPPQGRSLDEIQIFIIKHVLDRFKWNKSEVARYLGISRPRLRRLLANSDLEQDRRQR